ncbi:MAG: methyltransferase family protein [Gemmatimonadales bacterium]
MALREDFEAAGNWLFRHRGFVPLVLLPALLAAVGGFRYPASSHRLDLLWEGLCLAVSLLGLGVRVATVGFAPPGTSGRNRHEQVAAAVHTTGMYSLVRHPLYLGNYLMWLGVAMLPRVWWAPVLVSLAFALYYERIMFAEEEFLRRKFGATFMAWAARTPAIIPRRLQWQPPSRAFSSRTVLQREYSGLFALISSFTVLALAGDFAYTGKLALDPVWGVAFVATALVCAVLRGLKHRAPQAFPKTGDRHP